LILVSRSTALSIESAGDRPGSIPGGWTEFFLSFGGSAAAIFLSSPSASRATGTFTDGAASRAARCPMSSASRIDGAPILSRVRVMRRCS
jgi:hypothetical protein